MPSPEPDLPAEFWDRLPVHFDNERIKVAAQKLASLIAINMDPSRIVFASILRAGVPIADWLCQLLPGACAGAVSLFTGLGVDSQALQALQAEHAGRKVIFVDGWTGRGGVAFELRRRGLGPLAVLVDPWAVADFAGTMEDVLCPSACFTGTATLGFSRTFKVDDTQMFNSYLFPMKYCRPDVVSAWQAQVPDFSAATADRSHRTRFYIETNLRLHSNEVCRALINAAPTEIFFADAAECDDALLLELAEWRGVPVRNHRSELRGMRARVACSLAASGQEAA
jgi:hypothetical protein